MPSWALGTTTSPIQYQSNSSAGLSSGWATNPSSDMHMWVSTLVMPVRLGRRRRLIGRQPSCEAGGAGQTKERMVRVTGVTANLPVADIEVARSFYADFLGLAVEEMNLGW